MWSLVPFAEPHELYRSKTRRVAVVEEEDTAAVEVGEAGRKFVAVTVGAGRRLVVAGVAYRSLAEVEAAGILAGVALRWVVRTSTSGAAVAVAEGEAAFPFHLVAWVQQGAVPCSHPSTHRIHQSCHFVC